MEESEQKVRPFGELGKYLHDYRLTHEHFTSPKKGFFDLGDTAALLAPEIACWDETESPEVGWDLRYRFGKGLGKILRCDHIDRDATFNLLYDKLKENYG